MKKICTIFFSTLLLVFSFVVAEASSIQDPALWPAIDDITKTGDVYTFKVNVRAYCPRGLSGNLLVAAYDENERLLVLKDCGMIEFAKYTVPGNCSDKDNLARNFSTTLELKEKERVIIRAFVISLDTLKPEIPSGKITFNYNNGDSYIEVGYILGAKYDETLSEEETNLYYYYYYDGNCNKVDYLFKRTGFQSSYFGFESCDNVRRVEITEKLNGTTLSNYEFSGIKIFCYIDITQNFYLDKDFNVSGIKIYCDFSNLE